MSGAGTYRIPIVHYRRGGVGAGRVIRSPVPVFIFCFVYPRRYHVRYPSGSGARHVAAEAPVDQREFLQEGRRFDSVLQLSPGDTWAPRTVIISFTTGGQNPPPDKVDACERQP